MVWTFGARVTAKNLHWDPVTPPRSPVGVVVAGTIGSSVILYNQLDPLPVWLLSYFSYHFYVFYWNAQWTVQFFVFLYGSVHSFVFLFSLNYISAWILMNSSCISCIIAIMTGGWGVYLWLCALPKGTSAIPGLVFKLATYWSLPIRPQLLLNRKHSEY